MTESSQQLHPMEVGSSSYFLLLNSQGQAVVWVAGFAVLIPQMNSFQDKKKDQMGFYSYCNACSLNTNSGTWEPRQIKLKHRAWRDSEVRGL